MLQIRLANSSLRQCQGAKASETTRSPRCWRRELTDSHFVSSQVWSASGNGRIPTMAQLGAAKVTYFCDAEYSIETLSISGRTDWENKKIAPRNWGRVEGDCRLLMYCGYAMDDRSALVCFWEPGTPAAQDSQSSSYEQKGTHGQIGINLWSGIAAPRLSRWRRQRRIGVGVVA